MNTVTYAELDQVRHDVAELVPGYYRSELNPFAALEKQQGNCFTSAVIAAVALALAYDSDASLVWSERLHAREISTTGFHVKGANTEGKIKDIQHVTLVAPRGIDQYDILALSFGENVTEGSTVQSAFMKTDEGARIYNYNFMDVSPEDENVVDYFTRSHAEEPLLMTTDDYEVTTTAYGASLGLVSMDWQRGANEYLTALDVPPIDFEALAGAFMPRLIAMRDWRRTNGVNSQVQERVQPLIPLPPI